MTKALKYGDVFKKFSGSDLNFILANIPSRKVLKRLSTIINGRLTISAKEIVHIMECGQSCQHLLTTITKGITKYVCAFIPHLSRKIWSPCRPANLRLWNWSLIFEKVEFEKKVFRDKLECLPFFHFMWYELFFLRQVWENNLWMLLMGKLLLEKLK
mgnify:CR=1 FL=1